MKWEAIDIEWSRQCTDFLMSPVLDLMIDLLCGSYKIGNYCMPIGPIIKMINQKGKNLLRLLHTVHAIYWEFPLSNLHMHGEIKISRQFEENME